MLRVCGVTSVTMCVQDTKAEPPLLSLDIALGIRVYDVKLDKEWYVRNTNAECRFCDTNPCSLKPGDGSPATIVFIFKQLYS